MGEITVEVCRAKRARSYAEFEGDVVKPAGGQLMCQKRLKKGLASLAGLMIPPPD